MKAKTNMEIRRFNNMYMLQNKLLNNAYLFDSRDNKEELDLS
jgi:hypothetical protein